MAAVRSRCWDVVGAGAAAVDELVFVAGAISDGKGRVLRRERRFGGNIATALAVAARAGASTAFIGHLPDEASGSDLLEQLRAEGIDLSAARMSPHVRAIRSTILVGERGERFIAYDDDTPIGLPEDLDLDLVRNARVVVLDSYGVAAGVRAVAAARAAGVAVVVDVEQARHRQTGELLDLADHLVLPRDFALHWTGTANPAQAVEGLWRTDRAAVVITDGADGCWYRSADDAQLLHHHPALDVAVVDTTGCGDAFHGGYAAALARGAAVADCVVAATAAAADCATRVGGFGPAPRPADSNP